jgi:hypothetical protein
MKSFVVAKRRSLLVFALVVLPESKAALARQQIMQTILERVSFGKLAPHPARTSSVRDDRRHPAYVSDWMTAGKFAKALQLGPTSCNTLPDECRQLLRVAFRESELKRSLKRTTPLITGSAWTAISCESNSSACSSLTAVKRGSSRTSMLTGDSFII